MAAKRSKGSQRGGIAADFRTLVIGLIAVALVTGGTFTACSQTNGNGDPAMPDGFDPDAVQRLEIERKSGGSVTLPKVTLRHTTQQRREGYKHYNSIPDGEGMLFLWKEDRPKAAMTMRECHVPLTVAFIDRGGKIVDMIDMDPGGDRYETNRGNRYALEVPQGWFERNGVAVGDRVVLSEGIRYYGDPRRGR